MLKECRQHRPHCTVIKFCSPEHLALCKQRPAPKSKGHETPGCEALDVPQMVCLFCTLCAVGCPWAAVLVLLQLFLGERADAARSARFSWLRNVSQDDDDDGTSGSGFLDLPEVWIPDGVDKKTANRKIALDRAFCTLLRTWLRGAPLTGQRGAQWPWEGQAISPGHCLFPGKSMQSQRRSWEEPATERAYLAAIKKATAEIARSRHAAENQGKVHIFTDVDLPRIGTHAVKKTCVSLLAEDGASMTLIAAITNTSTGVLRRHYDVATNGRKRRAVASALGPVVKQLTAGGEEPEAEGSDEGRPDAENVQRVTIGSRLDRWCPFCGKPVEQQWLYCYCCGKLLPKGLS